MPGPPAIEDWATDCSVLASDEHMKTACQIVHSERRSTVCKERCVHVRVGYELIYNCPQATPMILTLNTHHSRASDLVTPDYMTTEPSVPIKGYRDGFGNWCN